MNDTKMLIEVRGKLRHLSRAVAVKQVAKKFEYTLSGVSGMVSRAENSIVGQIALMDYLSTTLPSKAPSQQKIDAIVTDGQAAFEAYKDGLEGMQYAVFLSDLHIPEQNNRALNLVYTIINDLSNVAYISTLNDGLDFAKLSFWDRRGLSGNALENDLANSLEIHSTHLRILRQIAPNALFPAVIGNHDLRIATYGKEAGIGDYNAAMLMERLAGEGVTFTSSIARYNAVILSEGLVWGHGVYTSINRVSAAKKNYAYYKRTLPAPFGRTDFDLIFGHTHGQTTVQNGTHKIINAGCLCNLQPHYMRHLPDWRLGFVISQFDPHGFEVDSAAIAIKSHDGRMYARNPLNGKVYHE